MCVSVQAAQFKAFLVAQSSRWILNPVTPVGRQQNYLLHSGLSFLCVTLQYNVQTNDKKNYSVWVVIAVNKVTVHETGKHQREFFGLVSSVDACPTSCDGKLW